MIVHIVFIKLQDKSKASELKARMEALPAQIPEIKHYEIGIDEMDSARSFHMSLYSQFESFEGLKIYNDHPAHLEFLKHLKEHAEIVHAVDYTL